MVITPGVKDLRYELIDGEKVFTLVAEPIEWEILKGIYIKCWAYNRSIPGPTIHVLPGDKVRIRVINKLPQSTSVHWHGLIVPNVMDGVPGIEPTPYIEPGDCYDYRFTVVNTPGTYMYHSSVNTITQLNFGLSGGIIIDDLDLIFKKKYKDYFLMLQEWCIPKLTYGKLTSGIYNLDIQGKESNFFTINGKCFPDTLPIDVEFGDTVTLRFANTQMHNHPIHLHGHLFKVTANDGYSLPEDMQVYKNTILVVSGETVNITFKANNSGVWPLHCHIPHHMSNNGCPDLGGMLTTINYR